MFNKLPRNSVKQYTSLFTAAYRTRACKCPSGTEAATCFLV